MTSYPTLNALRTQYTRTHTVANGTFNALLQQRSTYPVTTAYISKFDAQACGWAANVNCTDSVPPNAVEPSGDFDCPGNGLFPDPANCRMFFRCHEDKAMSWLCADGQAFSPDLGKCAVDPEGKFCPEA